MEADDSTAENSPPSDLLAILSTSTGNEIDLDLPSLKKWNDEVEATNFADFSSQRREQEGREDPMATERTIVGRAAGALHDALVGTVSNCPRALSAPACAGVDGIGDNDNDNDNGNGNGNGNGNDNGHDGDDSSAAEAVGSYQRGDSPDDLAADAEAAVAARSVAARAEDWENIDTGCMATVRQTSELLRSVKNLIRYSNSIRMTSGPRDFGRVSRSATDDDDGGNDPLRRLRSCGMLSLYLAVLVGCCCSSSSSTSTDSSSVELAACRDDAARHASLSLFHATYGMAESNLAAARARAVLVDGVDFIPVLVRLLIEAGGGKGGGGGMLPPPLVLCLVRHAHSLVACDSSIVPRMDAAVRRISISTCTSSSAGDGTEGDNASNSRGNKNLVSVLAAILSSTIDSNGDDDIDGDGNGKPSSSRPPFPGTQASDRRPDLVTEILRVMFALRATVVAPAPPANASSSNDDDGSNQDQDGGGEIGVDYDAMTRIGESICRLLKLPLDERSTTSKLAAVNLLMDSQRGYARYLLDEGAIPDLLLVLRIQVDEVIERKTGGFNGDAAALVPILAVLDRLGAEDPEVLKLAKEEIFPLKDEEAYQARAAEERAKGGGGRPGLDSKNMKPAQELPPGTLRWKLVKLMTWPESNVKRCVSELLWKVCDCNATEFVLRTGFGNAVHMLGIKGIVSIPKETTFG